MNSKRFAGDARRVRVAVYLLTGLALGSGAGVLAQEPARANPRKAMSSSSRDRALRAT